MFGFDTINYSVRPNKIIQRNLAFDGVKMLESHLSVSGMKYIGFGSVWFADFILAHKHLAISDMLSIERDPILFKRAKFNAPFKTIKVVEGDSTTILEKLVKNRAAKQKPWLVWLDYVSGPTEEVVRDVDLIVDHSPANSILLVTLNVLGRTIGSGLEGRRTNLKRLFGDVVADDAELPTFQEDNLPRLIAGYVHDYIDNRCKSFARGGDYIPGFTMPYRDTTQMVTVGGILASEDRCQVAREVVENPAWPGMPSVAVETPPLTPKEQMAIQRILPNAQGVTRADLKRLGFDLEDGMLDVYCAHYRRYPSFFQVVA